MAEVKKALESSGDGEAQSGSHFIRAIIENDIRNNKVGGGIVTRFPPEPNGYLHIGHAKSICLNFGLAQDYDGVCNLRFDDTNPTTEDVEFVDAIKEDVRWLGFDWSDREYYASDYFEQLYEYAEHLIKQGKAYVDSLPEDEIRAYRGTVTEPGRESPYRNRPVEENLELFRKMRAGVFDDGEHVLRARGDLSSPNMKMRDPLLYRIRHAHHYRAGDAWCIYPMYDFAHPLSDAIEHITHSLCTLEFDNNRELYDWVLDNTVGDPRPHQYEFARGNLDYTVMSKRKLLRLVEEGHVSGWDDPRLPTLAGLRRRGVTPEAIRTFWEQMGVTKTESRAEIASFEHVIRDDLNFKAPRVMGVLRPLKVTITNYPEDEVKWLDAPYWPHDIPKEGSRKIPFGRELFIDRDDFQENPPKGYYRLSPGAEVRLRYGYFVTCDEVVKDKDGDVVELRCTYDPATRGGDAPDGRRVRGTIHWLAASEAVRAEVRVYDRLFRIPDPESGEEDFTAYINPDSLVVLEDALVEPSVLQDAPETRYQFEREGYFWRDPIDSSGDRLVVNRIVSLRDSWAKRMEETEPTSRKRAPQKSHSGDTAPPPPTTEERISELSDKQRDRFERLSTMGLSDDDAVIIGEDAKLTAYFERAVVQHDAPGSIANWVVNELLREVKGRSIDDFPIQPDAFAELVRFVDDDIISARAAKEVFAEMVETGKSARTVIDARNLEQISDPDALAPIISDIVSAFPEKVTEYQNGKTGLLGFFIGQVMGRTRGKANPELVKELLEGKLNG